MACGRCKDNPGFVLAYEKRKTSNGEEYRSGVPTLFKCECTEAWAIPAWARKLQAYSDEKHGENWSLSPFMEVHELRVDVPDEQEESKTLDLGDL